MATPQFWSRRLFKKSDKIKISYEGIAKRCHVTSRSAKNYIKRDIESGLITRQKNRYTHPLFQRVCDGRNTYLLTEEGRGVIGRRAPPPPNTPPPGGKSNKELLLPICKTVQEGETHSDFPKRVAQDVYKRLRHPNRPMHLSNPIQAAYKRSQSLKERGLDISIPPLKKLFRKGFSYLGSALSEMERLERDHLKSNNYAAFLNYRVSNAKTLPETPMEKKSPNHN